MYSFTLICLLHWISSPSSEDEKTSHTIIVWFPYLIVVFRHSSDNFSTDLQTQCFFKGKILTHLIISCSQTTLYQNYNILLQNAIYPWHFFDNKDCLVHIFVIILFCLSPFVMAHWVRIFPELVLNFFSQVCQGFHSISVSKNFYSLAISFHGSIFNN